MWGSLSGMINACMPAEYHRPGPSPARNAQESDNQPAHLCMFPPSGPPQVSNVLTDKLFDEVVPAAILDVRTVEAGKRRGLCDQLWLSSRWRLRAGGHVRGAANAWPLALMCALMVQRRPRIRRMRRSRKPPRRLNDASSWSSSWTGATMRGSTSSTSLLVGGVATGMALDAEFHEAAGVMKRAFARVNGRCGRFGWVALHTCACLGCLADAGLSSHDASPSQT